MWSASFFVAGKTWKETGSLVVGPYLCEIEQWCFHLCNYLLFFSQCSPVSRCGKQARVLHTCAMWGLGFTPLIRWAIEDRYTISMEAFCIGNTQISKQRTIFFHWAFVLRQGSWQSRAGFVLKDPFWASTFQVQHMRCLCFFGTTSLQESWFLIHSSDHHPVCSCTFALITGTYTYSQPPMESSTSLGEWLRLPLRQPSYELYS